MLGFKFFRRELKSNTPSDAPKRDPATVQPTAASLAIYGYIYSAVCRTNSKGYVGQTTQEPKERWQQHRQDATARKQRNGLTKRFHFALHEHGTNMFDFKVIDTASCRVELNEKERYWVAYYRYNNPEYGYNSTSGGASQKEQARSAHEADGQVSAEWAKEKGGFDWARRAIEPQKAVLRKFYRGRQPPYCICAGSHGEGGVCAACGRRTDLSVRHAGILIAEFLVRRNKEIPTAVETPEETADRERIFGALTETSTPDQVRLTSKPRHD
jgi:hypothetical protein